MGQSYGPSGLIIGIHRQSGIRFHKWGRAKTYRRKYLTAILDAFLLRPRNHPQSCPKALVVTRRQFQPLRPVLMALTIVPGPNHSDVGNCHGSYGVGWREMATITYALTQAAHRVSKRHLSHIRRVGSP